MTVSLEAQDLGEVHQAGDHGGATVPATEDPLLSGQGFVGSDEDRGTPQRADTGWRRLTAWASKGM
jgi:hypothetical protein